MNCLVLIRLVLPLIDLKVMDYWNAFMAPLPIIRKTMSTKLDWPKQVPLALYADKEELDLLLEQGIIVKSTSQWSSSMIPVRKPNGKLRICVDYRKLNAHTRRIPVYIPLLDEIVDRVGQSSVVSKLDLSKGFHQVPVKPEDQPKTAFVCPMGKFESCRMPFGLTNAPAVFQ